VTPIPAVIEIPRGRGLRPHGWPTTGRHGPLPPRARGAPVGVTVGVARTAASTHAGSTTSSANAGRIAAGVSSPCDHSAVARAGPSAKPRVRASPERPPTVPGAPPARPRGWRPGSVPPGVRCQYP
jgi:hypothetical protein